jgi:putative ATP-dependent endonuclease of the OLD family
MKIRRFVLQNVASYRDRVAFTFDNRLNILIGPNGGGKSNLQKTLALVLSHYFIHQYDFKRDDNEAKVEPVSLWSRRVLERALPRFLNDDSPQEIEITLIPESSDIENIRVIGANLDRFNKELDYYDSPVTSYGPAGVADLITPESTFTYTIRELDLQEPDPETGAWAFKEYLRTFFIFLRLSSRLADIRLTAPVFFFFSERTSKGRMEIQSNQFTEQNYFSGYRSAYQAATGENTNLLQWGTQHFARLHWKAVNEAAERRDTTARDLFRSYQDVKLLTRYMTQLGYEWTFLMDSDSVSYGFALRKDDSSPWLTSDMFSSGEKEIVHFLLAMFALNVKDGVVLIDEPELHLHPRWQRIFLGLFRDIAPSRNNQFVITTHSPVFVTPDTINNITRVYRKAGGASERIALRDVDLPEKKNLVRMINSQNNERVFFADRAVLVEGITDRLVVASLLDSGSALFANNDAIEIIEVGGKGNFAEYRKLLDALNTPMLIVADLDYLKEVGSISVRTLFDSDGGRAWEALRQKKSLDGATAIRGLRSALQQDDREALAAFLEYLDSRHARLRESLTETQNTLIEDELARLLAERILVLRHGEMEDYLPPEVRDIKALVELTTDRNWLIRVPEPSHRLVLGSILCEALDLRSELKRQFLQEIGAGTVDFPKPLA